MTPRLAFLLVALAAACESKTNDPFVGFDFAGTDGFVFTEEDLSSSDGPTLSGLDLAGNAEGPTVTIVSPAKDAEVQYDTLVVTATIVGKNGAFIDGNSVQLVIPANNTSGFSSAPMTLTATADTYQGQIDISAIKSGPSEFTVIATDVNGKIGTGGSTYIHDHGPIVTFIQPTQSTAHGSLNLQVQVVDLLHPVTDPTKVKATVRAGDSITLTAIPSSNPLRVQGVIKFSDYSPELDGDQLVTVSATNDHGTIGRGIKQFTVDNFGPQISFVNPVAGQFIGGVLQIRANIEDISGVNDGSVIAVFGGDLTKAVQLTRTAVASPLFQGLFDVRQLGTNYVLPTLSIRADDLLGLHSELAETIIVDNVPPVMSFDPPNLIFQVRVDDDTIRCSQPFDPVGEDSANDLDKVPQIITLRARIEDRGNFAPGLKVERVSKVNPATVYLYGIPASNGPLAVDTDGDGSCDDVNPLLVPTTNITASNQAIAVQMASIPPGGAHDMRTTPSPPNMPPTCTLLGSAGSVRPPPLCSAFEGLRLHFAKSYTSDDEPSIWTIPPVDAGADQCVGLQFDSLNRIPEGPSCFVVVSRDMAGNHSVSLPLRLCVDRGGGMCNSWPASPPACVGTYNKVTMMTNTTPCTLPSPFPETLFPKL